MDRMLYLAMSAAKQTMTAQAAISHNLANATTNGFRADLLAFRSMPVFGDGQPTRVYAMAERPGIDFRHGSVHTTGNDLDVALNGDGWIAVQAPDGSEAYTRAGSLHLNANGLLQTATKQPVLGNGGPIAVPPAESLVIGIDGTISIRPVGQEATTLAQVDRIKLVDPPLESLVKGDDGLFRLVDGAQAPASATVRVTQGALETSNVNAVEAMVAMIELQRRFEMEVKAMQTAQENDASAAQMLRLT